MPIVIIIAIFVAIGIGVSVAKEAARKKEQAEAESAMRKFDEKEELKKYVSPTTTQKTSSNPPTVQTQQSSAQSAKERLASRLQQLQKVESEIRSMSHHDDEYCAVKHESTDKYKVEKVPVMNSIGGKSTEGCADHYDVRYVKIDEKVIAPRELTDLQKIVVYGEIINQPAFKKRYRR